LMKTTSAEDFSACLSMRGAEVIACGGFWPKRRSRWIIVT
jgi:hypothetical protein